MSLESEILNILEQTKTEIQNNLAAKNINASGRTSRSLQVKQDQNGMRLVGGGGDAAPFDTTEIGRPGGRVPSGFYQIIKDWTFDKGLSFSSETERGTFSYFVARKIAREGTLRYHTHQDVFSTPSKNAVTSIRQIINSNIANSLHAAINSISASASTPL